MQGGPRGVDVIDEERGGWDRRWCPPAGPQNDHQPVGRQTLRARTAGLAAADSHRSGEDRRDRQPAARRELDRQPRGMVDAAATTAQRIGRHRNERGGRWSRPPPRWCGGGDLRGHQPRQADRTALLERLDQRRHRTRVGHRRPRARERLRSRRAARAARPRQPTARAARHAEPWQLLSTGATERVRPRHITGAPAGDADRGNQELSQHTASLPEVV